MYILLVDDMTLVGRVIQPLIESLGKKLLVAANALEAFQILGTYGKEVDLILLDWHMPVMSGLEFLQRIKADQYWKKIPVIMLTSNNSRTGIAEAFSAGVSNYIVKPFSLDDLRARIEELFDKLSRKKNIMLVDDSNVVLLMLKRLLNKMGYDISGIARNGLEAVQQFSNIRPTLVFMDINMPGMDGISAIKAIKQIQPNAKIICMTASRDPEREVKIRELGVKTFLYKPFEEEKVYTTLVDELN
jgi:two-component system, sensor histidine kinase and response regulator